MQKLGVNTCTPIQALEACWEIRFPGVTQGLQSSCQRLPLVVLAQCELLPCRHKSRFHPHDSICSASKGVSEHENMQWSDLFGSCLQNLILLKRQGPFTIQQQVHVRLSLSKVFLQRRAVPLQNQNRIYLFIYYLLIYLFT